MKPIRVLALVHDHLVPPDDTTGIDVLEAEWKMEYDVIETLRESGHQVRVLGVHDDLVSIRKVVEEFWTLDEVPGKRVPSATKVFVLTSGRTFSGAEEFTYNLKNLKRATVIGETTGGGAHPIRPARINDRVVVTVPFMRANNPISKTNWEGSGVAPDVQCAAADALDKAIELANTQR